jgi:hypothetical protein
MEQTNSSEHKTRIAKIAAVILVALGIVYYLNLVPLWLIFGWTNEYQAVFLTNGQVYFGKLYEQNRQFANLREVYYLQVTQPPQPLREGEVPPSNINLVKLGGELHGPQDEMKINRDHILFVEDLKPDSRVVQAILQLKTSQQQ